jgi:pyridinium-3,5-bisthiocarboxylic acid mononucleotide nickel chelatase
MEKIIYLDCFSGISGDMMIGALLDLGLDFECLSEELGKLGIGGYRIKKRDVISGSIRAVKFDVEVTEKQVPRKYSDIKDIITGSSLDRGIKKKSIDIFENIARAESKIHAKDISEVHFHEVGAVDSIIDIVGTAVGLHRMDVKMLYSSPVPIGSGYIDTAHGRLPAPAPATLEILKGVPVYRGDFDFEVTTPTGAGIIKTLVSGYGSFPDMVIENIGYGAGSKGISGDGNSQSAGLPDVLRIFTGKETAGAGEKMPPSSKDTAMLSANIDDINPEVMGYVMEKMIGNEAVRDVWLEHIYMKKNRPAFKLSVICDIKNEADIAYIIFKETTTTGIRREVVDRYCLERKIEKIKLPYGEAEVKRAFLGGKVTNVSPEYETCRKLAEKTGKPLKEIYRDVILFFSRR